MHARSEIDAPDVALAILNELKAIRVKAREWMEGVRESERESAARVFVCRAVREYVKTKPRIAALVRVALPAKLGSHVLEESAGRLATRVGKLCASLDVEGASYHISTTYTVLVPAARRTELGMYYTPPALANRLLDMAELAGVNWKTARVIDPACGGGAFLVPVVNRIRSAMAECRPKVVLRSIEERIKGLEIDPFAAWLTETWLRVALSDLLGRCRCDLPKIVQVGDALSTPVKEKSFDLVVGNPPYGRVSLSTLQRKRFSRSLYGHANLYGIFADLAARSVCVGGTIAFVTPTSFLAGEYFKRLRTTIAQEAPPLEVDFVEARRGIFEDVLQETMLATYGKRPIQSEVRLNCLVASTPELARSSRVGSLVLPDDPAEPWIAPRDAHHEALVSKLRSVPGRLSDLGYEVATGPLVWNRHKPQLRKHKTNGELPLIWSEAIVAAGRFEHRSQKKNHSPYFALGPGDNWLKVNTGCVLVQRTTAKEQRRRIIAAELPDNFIRENGGVVVENHLNMIRPAKAKHQRISAAALAAVLNTDIVDNVFRCISGSVAVSAFELEALPLPTPEALSPIEQLVGKRSRRSDIENAVRRLYGLVGE